jgi:hypothetical protein
MQLKTVKEDVALLEQYEKKITRLVNDYQI